MPYGTLRIAKPFYSINANPALWFKVLRIALAICSKKLTIAFFFFKNSLRKRQGLYFLVFFILLQHYLSFKKSWLYLKTLITYTA